MAFKRSLPTETILGFSDSVLNLTWLQDIWSQMLSMEDSAVILILEKRLSPWQSVWQQGEE